MGFVYFYSSGYVIINIICSIRMKLKNILKSFAPTIATAIGGPFGGMAAGLVKSALGIKKGDGKNLEQAVEQAIATGDPEVIAKLKQAENQMTVDLAKIALETEKVHSGDRDSARQREIKVGGYINAVLAIMAIVGWLAICSYVIVSNMGELPQAKALLIGGIIGNITAIVVQIINYYFGSSKSSKDKTDLMNFKG